MHSLITLARFKTNFCSLSGVKSKKCWWIGVGALDTGGSYKLSSATSDIIRTTRSPPLIRAPVSDDSYDPRHSA